MKVRVTILSKNKKKSLLINYFNINNKRYIYRMIRIFFKLKILDLVGKR